MAVSAQNVTTFGTINTQIKIFLTSLIRKIARQAKINKKMDVLRHIWRLLLLHGHNA